MRAILVQVRRLLGRVQIRQSVRLAHALCERAPADIGQLGAARSNSASLAPNIAVRNRTLRRPFRVR
jgi:hypothetical protein